MLTLTNNEFNPAAMNNAWWKKKMYTELCKICEKSKVFVIEPARCDEDSSVFAVILGPSTTQLRSALHYDGLKDIYEYQTKLNNFIHINACSYTNLIVKHWDASSIFKFPKKGEDNKQIPLWAVRASIAWDIDEPEDGFYDDYKIRKI